jgi:uncharacterized protein
VIDRRIAEMSMPDLTSFADAAARARGKGLPPVHLWNPPYCGEIDIRIAADGAWFHEGTPIGRPALVKLFASILRKDPERHVLVTPVEMLGITVEDAPFLAVELMADEGPEGPRLTFRTNVDDVTTADEAHPLRFERESQGGLKPYVLVRGGLWAKATRAVYLELVERAETAEVDGAPWLGLRSAGRFFPMAPAAEIETLA